MTPRMQRSECVICFTSEYSDDINSPLRFYSTPCNHHYHFQCLKTWCITNNTCPTCRTDSVMDLELHQQSTFLSNNDNDNNHINVHNNINSILDFIQNHYNNTGTQNNINSILDFIHNHYYNTGTIRRQDIFNLFEHINDDNFVD